MSWGRGLFMSFVAFALFIATLVTVCLKQEIGLVSPDYYADELAFQEQIDRLDNVATLHEVPTITISNDSLKVTCSFLLEVDKAVLKLTRPSSVKYDATFVIESRENETSFRYAIGHLPRGRYKGSLRWAMKGKEYYVETLLDL